MHSRVHVAAIMSCAAALFVGACGGTPGNAQPVPESKESTHSSGRPLPRHGAPEVTNPLDVGMIKQDPCDAITAHQAKTFSGTVTDTEIESGDCVWNYDGGRYLLGSISGGLDLDNSEGLTRYYAQKDKGNWQIEPIEPISGYPALIHDVDLKSVGGCVVVVGVQNDLVYTASTQLGSEHPSSDTPCKVAKKLAGFVIGNLKEAQ